MQGVHGWAEGGDPEEFGWVFDATGVNITAYTLAYQTPDRQSALEHGVPANVLDEYDATGPGNHPCGYGFGLSDWLQENT